MAKKTLRSSFCEQIDRFSFLLVEHTARRDAEQAETQHWIDTALACEYISPEIQNQLLTKCREIGKMLGSMIAYPEKFCKSSGKSK
jgi:four helix bundle protein